MRLHMLLALFAPSWPEVMHTWLHTACNSNPTVTFSIITPLEFSDPSWASTFYNMPVPPNLHLIGMDFDQFLARADTTLGMGLVAASNVLKASDFRPAFGTMFADELRGYTHWGWVDITTVMGNIVDIVDHFHPQEDIIYFSEKDYTNGAIGIFRNTKFVSQLFKAVPRDLSDHVFYETKSHVAGFEEGIFPCQMMKQESVTARLFPNTVCDKVQAWWWYKGKFFHLGGKCLYARFSGGARSQSVEKEQFLVQGMTDYHQNMLYSNASVGFGYMRKLFYFFVVNDVTLEIDIFDMNDPDNNVWKPAPRQQLGRLFKASYERSYNREATFTSVFRRGNLTDSRPWSNYCKVMQKHKSVIVDKLPSEDVLLV